MKTHATHNIGPKHVQCCECCRKCFPNLEVEPGKCAICPIFGRQCDYGLKTETNLQQQSQMTRPDKIY